MKATIDLPADLYRQVKARAALEGRAVREVTIELYGWWLAGASSSAPVQAPEQWLEEWLALADEVVHGPADQTAREHLEAGRGRLEGHDADGRR